MRALYWNGVNDLRVGTVPDPTIVNPHDAILKVTLSTTCGSDLHIVDGYLPTMKPGDIMGHEFMGEVVETGPEVRKVKKGDRVVVPSFIVCGECWYCQHQLFSLCDNTHPKPELQVPMFGYPTAGIYGYTHAFGGYAGSHAEYVRVPFADNDCFHAPEGVPDEQVLFLSDAAPTGYMGADFCDIKPGDTIAVWGCGGVGLMAQRSAYLLGAERVIAIDRFPERLRMAREKCGSETINYTEVDSVVETLKEMTGGRGPDACIDAVGMEAHGTGIRARLRQRQAGAAPPDRPGHGAARGDHGLPQGRDPLDPRRLRADGQVPHRRDHEQGPHGAHRPSSTGRSTCRACWSTRRRASSTRRSSRRTGSRSRTGRAATRCSSTRKTAASARSSRRDGRVSTAIGRLAARGVSQAPEEGRP